MIDRNHILVLPYIGEQGFHDNDGLVPDQFIIALDVKVGASIKLLIPSKLKRILAYV